SPTIGRGTCCSRPTRLFTMRLKKLFIAVVAVSIVHSLGALGPRFAQPVGAPAGNAARGAVRANDQRPGEVSVSTVVVVKNLNSADSVAIADYYALKRKLP